MSSAYCQSRVGLTRQNRLLVSSVLAAVGGTDCQSLVGHYPMTPDPTAEARAAAQLFLSTAIEADGWDDEDVDCLALALDAFAKERVEQAEKERDEARLLLQRARDYKGIEGWPCPLCTYENGKFIARCQMHTRMDSLEAELARVREDLRQRSAECDHWYGLRDERDRLKARLSPERLEKVAREIATISELVPQEVLAILQREFGKETT